LRLTLRLLNAVEVLFILTNLVKGVLHWQNFNFKMVTYEEEMRKVMLPVFQIGYRQWLIAPNNRNYGQHIK